MKNKNYYIILGLSLFFVILQIFDFPRNYLLAFLIPGLKLVVGVTTVVLILVLFKKWHAKILLTVVFILFVFLTYELSLWKIYAKSYVQFVEEKYTQAAKVVSKDSTFMFITYDSINDSLNIYGGEKRLDERFTSQEQNYLKGFMRENEYIEFWNDQFGIAFIFNRFLDNRFGILYSPNNEKQKMITKSKNKFKTYIKLDQEWYYFSAI